MKKKALITLLTVLTLILSLVACGSDNEETDNEAYITLDSYYNTLIISTNDNESPTYETQTIDYAGAVGTTLGESMEAVGDVSIKAVAESDEFEGWMEFIVHIETDEDGFDTYTYERVSDTLYTTEELLEKTFTEEQKVYAAKWASIDMESYYAEEDYMWTAESLAIQLDANGGTMNFQDAEDESYEADSYTYWMTEGESINTLVADAESGYDAMMSIEKLDAEFANWTVYKGDSITWSSEASDEEGDMSLETTNDSEGFEYVILGNGTLYKESVTTEELCELVCDGSTNYYAVANWK